MVIASRLRLSEMHNASGVGRPMGNLHQMPSKSIPIAVKGLL